MSLKLQAAKQTAGLLALAAISGIVTSEILARIPAEYLSMVLSIGAVIGCTYVMYVITLGQLEYREKLKDLNKAMDKIKT